MPHSQTVVSLIFKFKVLGVKKWKILKHLHSVQTLILLNREEISRQEARSLKFKVSSFLFPGRIAVFGNSLSDGLCSCQIAACTAPGSHTHVSAYQMSLLLRSELVLFSTELPHNQPVKLYSKWRIFCSRRLFLLFQFLGVIPSI